jgi:hypothetical protein
MSDRRHQRGGDGALRAGAAAALRAQPRRGRPQPGRAGGRHPYVAFCDDDLRWRPGSLGRAADLLDAHPRLASVPARILVAPDLVEDPITPELRDSPVPAPPWLPGPALLSVLAGARPQRHSVARRYVG